MAQQRQTFLARKRVILTHTRVDTAIFQDIENDAIYKCKKHLLRKDSRCLRGMPFWIISKNKTIITAYNRPSKWIYARIKKWSYETGKGYAVADFGVDGKRKIHIKHYSYCVRTEDEEDVYLPPIQTGKWVKLVASVVPSFKGSAKHGASDYSYVGTSIMHRGTWGM